MCGMPEMVPVKTKYPGRPPEHEPKWVHLDWIQTTAAILAEDWKELSDCRENWSRLRHAGINSETDPEIQWQMERWRYLQDEVVPLFGEVMARFPLEVWSKFQYIRNAHDASREPAAAKEEWGRVRDYALDRLSKMRSDATPEAVTEAPIINNYFGETVSHHQITNLGGNQTVVAGSQNVASGEGSKVDVRPAAKPPDKPWFGEAVVKWALGLVSGAILIWLAWYIKHK
jgi:hypothetical protein